MKAFTFGIVLLLFSCKSVKNESFQTAINENITIENSCPTPGNCTVEVMDNTSILLQRDDANMLYPKYIENTCTKVLKFTYTKRMAQEAADGQYKEEVIFEVSKDKNSLSLKNTELSNVKLLHGRFCYCKGSAGYFEINEGDLEIKDGKITLNFKNNAVPQIIKKIALSY